MRILLAMALLHLSVAPAWAGPPRHRWPTRLVTSLAVMAAQEPGHTLPCKAWLLDGRVLAGDLLAVEQEPDSLYQPRLTHWQGSDPARAVLPPLGQDLQLAKHYVVGRPVHGAFRGFNGPHLLLGRMENVRETVDRIPVARERLICPAGSLSLDGRELDRRNDWPPSRTALLVYTAAGVQRIALDEVRDLQVTRRADPAGIILGTALVLFVLTLTFIYVALSQVDFPIGNIS